MIVLKQLTASLYLMHFLYRKLNDMVKQIAQYRIFSIVGLKSAYHQIPLNIEVRKYTAFEACGGLYPFTRHPIGVTNGVTCFQRAILQFVEE